MKTVALLLISLLICHAHAGETDPQNACERGIKLPQGYEFTEFTTDCQYNQNLTPIKKDQRYGYANAQGQIKIPARFEMAYGFDEGLALVKLGGKYGFIDKTGSLVIKAVYDDAWGFLGGRANVLKDGKYGFIDKRGNLVIKTVYDQTGHWFESGLTPAKQGNKWGYIDPNGTVKIPFVYDMADDFSEGMAMVGQKSDGSIKFGYINPKNQLVLPFGYDHASAFVGGTAMVMTNGTLYHINPQGQKVPSPITKDELTQ